MKSIVRKLTKEQQKIVEDNHNLIYSFLQSRGLNIDEYYGLIAESLCKSVLNWDESKGALSTLFYIVARNDLYKEWRSGQVGHYQFEDTVPLDEEWCSVTYDLENDLIMKETLEEISKSKYKELFELKRMGYTNKEISELFGVSESTIGNWVRKMGDKYFNRKG